MLFDDVSKCIRCGMINKKRDENRQKKRQRAGEHPENKKKDHI